MVSLNEMYDKYLTQGPKNFNLYELKSRLPEFLSPVREKLAKLLREVNNILFYAGIPYTTKEINDTDLKEFVIRARELRRELGILSKDYMDKAPKQEECPACGGLNTAPLDDKDECYDCGIIYTYAPHEKAPQECKQCQSINCGPSHNGSPRCKSGSIASGGKHSHCSCDTCF